MYGTNEQTNIGLAKYASIVKQTRKNSENVLVIDNGDLIQGTPLMTHYIKKYQHQENPMIEIMNKLQIDAAVIGNHEFNYGKEVLENAVKQSQFPWISANIIDQDTQETKFGPPYIMKKLRNGVKVAIVGITTHYIPNWEDPNHIKGIEFSDAFTTLERWVKHIIATEKPDILIASYHGGFERDLTTGRETELLTGENQAFQMCKEIAGIDILLTGHQHRILNDKIHDVLIMQPGNNGKAYGKINIQLENINNNWSIVNKTGSICYLNDVDPDKGVLSYIEPLESSTQQWLDTPIGYIDGDMTIKDPFKARKKKHSLIELIQKIQMDASGVDISVTSLLNNDTKGFDSVVTMRDVVSNYMYPNTLVVLELSGRDIIEALEQSAAYFIIDEHGDIQVNPTYITPKPQHYNYDMWEGINYSIHVSHPVGSRIKNVTYKGEPLQSSKLYKVVLNNYRAGGGGNYEMFKNKQPVMEIQKDAVQLISDYFEERQTIQATVTNNFIVKK